MDTLTLARDFASLLLDTAAKGTVLLLLACLAAWLGRRSSAALRHSIWCLTMGGLLLLPVASWALPAWQIPILPPAPAVPVAEVVRLSPSPPQGTTGEGFDSPVLRHSTTEGPVLGQSTFKDTGGPERPPVAPSAPSVVEPAPISAPAIVEPTAPALTALEWTAILVSTGWSLGVTLFGCLLLVGLWRTVQLRRASLAISDGEWPGMLGELQQRLGLSRSVELREHALSVVPLTWGIWRPVVLLPKLARKWDEPMRRAVLLHELAHVQRGDVACQVLGRLTCVLYWFHPLAWFALRQLRQEREQACDDAVVGTGEKASDYAEQLLQVARLCCAPRGLSLGVAMAEGSSIERRILSLFDSARSHGPLTRRVAIASFLIGGAILAGLAPIEPTASQAEPPVVEATDKENIVAQPLIEIQERNLDGDTARAKASQVVTGVVIDAHNQPVAGATVWCDVDQDKTTRQPITARVETNAQGEFRFTVPQSSLDYGQGHFQHAAWAWKQGHGIGVGVAVASTLMPKNPEVRLRLPETSAVTLQVVDEKGEPLAGAAVSPQRVQASQAPGMPQDGPFSMVALPPNELRGIATRKTDAEGRATLDLVPRRFLSSVLVSSASHGEQSFSYYADVLKLNAVTSLDGELSNHQAGVRLTLSTSQTQPQTEKRGPREIISAHVQVVTDTQGRFAVPIFPVGECTIASEELNGPQFLSANSLKGELAAGVINKITLDVVTGIPVKGRIVVRGENKGVANASVYVQTFANLETSHVAQTLCQTDKNGEYSSYTLPGHYVASDLASLGHDATLIHPQLSSYPPSFQQPPQIAADAKEAVIPDILVDRGKDWSGTLVDENENPIDGMYVMPLQSGKRLAPPFPTLQGGKFSFNLVKGATPQAWHLIVDQVDPEARTLPLQVLKKDPLVLQTKRDVISKSTSDSPQESFSPWQDYTGGFSPEEIEESRIATEGVGDVLKKVGLSDEEITRFNTVGPNDLTGIVLDAATQEPIAGADIKLMMVPLKTTTDARGIFRVEGLKLPPEFSQAEFPNGIPALGTVRKDGYAPRAFCQPLGKAGFVVLLDNQTYFEGVITDPAGRPVAGASVKSIWETLLGIEGQEVPLPLSSSTTTNADGTYRLPVGSSLPNSGGGNTWRNEGHNLQVIAPGVGSARKTEEYIGPHSQTKLSLQLIPAIHFRAKVIDSLTGAPAPGFVLYTTDAPYIQGRSDSEGNLVIKDLLPGDVHFVAGDSEAIPYENFEWEGPEYVYRNERYGRWWSPDAKPGQGWSGLGLHVPKENQLQGNHDALRFKLIPELPIQTIMVERTATISGRVIDPDGRPVSGAKITPICDGRTVGEHETTSQEDGRYVLSVLASKNVKYHLMVQDGAAQAWANGVSADLATNPAQEIANFDLQLTRPGRVTGRVVRNGKPVADYPVRTVDCEHREYVYYGPSTRTKADGTFELSRVRPGKHFLRAGDLRWPLDKDKGAVIEVVAGEVVADQVLEVKQEPEPAEGVVPEPTPAAEGPAAPQKEPTPVGQNEDSPKADADVELEKVVWWGEAVDGLEPGFWLTKSEDPRNLRIPMNSLVNYRVVVRNTMDKEIEFLVRLLPFGGKDVPYLIPSDKLDPKGRITPPQPAKEFQARGAAKELYGLNAVQAITLDAGESVLLPECGLYVGKAPDERYPQIADFVPGTHWIVQPLLVHPLTFKERGEFDRLGGRDTVTKIARDGKTRQEGVVYVTGSWDQELKPAYAKYHLEVGTLDAEAHRNAEKATWGEIEQGMQCGIRLLNPQATYKIGDTLEAEVLWRNTSEAVISTTRPRQLDLYPIIEDAEGKQPQIDFGARYRIIPGQHDFQPGEVRSLGVTKVTLVAQGTPGPKDNKEPGHITLEPGKYKLSASGGVGNISPRSGKYEFTVVSDRGVKVEPKPAALGSAENPVVLITGRAINQQRQPLAGATIVLSDVIVNDGMRKAQTLANAKTDDSGAFQMEVSSALLHRGDPPAVLLVWAWTDTVQQDGFGMLPLTTDSNAPMEIVVVSPRAEEIRVVGSEGAPLTGILEQVNYGWGEYGILPDELLQQVVPQKDFQGSLTLHGFPWNADNPSSKLPDVRRGIWIREAGRGRHFFAWRPEPASSGPTTLAVPKPVKFRGQLVAPDGQPLPGDLDQVRVSLEINYQDKALTEGWYFHNAGSVLCDSEGRFEIDGIEPVTETGVHFQASLGMIKGWTWRKVFIPELKSNANGIIAVELPLVRTRSVRGQLVSTKGEPLPGIGMSIAHGIIEEEVRSDGGTNSRAERNEEFQSDAQGRFSVEVIPGVIKVSKSISLGSNMSTALAWPESLPMVRGNGRLQIDEGESPLDLPPLAISILSGQVVDEQLRPYSGMIIGNGETPQQTLGIGFSKADGMFRIEATGEPVTFRVLSMENSNQIPFGKQDTETVVKSRDPLVLQVVPKKETAAGVVPPKEPTDAVPASPKEERAAAPSTITGQIVNDKLRPLSRAEVVLILEEDNDSTQAGRVVAQAATDDEGRYALALPPEVATSKKFGAIWARAKGHTMARGHWSSVIPALSDRKDQLVLTATAGTKVQVLDQSGIPQEGVRLRASRIGIAEGVGYAPPTGWEDQTTATTDSHGDATLIAVVPDSLQGLTLLPPGDMVELQFGRNYFLNVRPERGRHFSFRLPETGSVDGRLHVAEGHRLPAGFTLSVRSCSLELPQFDGVVRVPVAADGTFHIDQIPVGQLIVPPFLPEDQQLRAVVPPHVEVQAGKTAKLEVAVAPGVQVQGRIQRSDLKTGFAKYPVTVIYGQSITNRRVDSDWQKFELTTNEAGVFTCILPPGPIEVQAATRMDGYQKASSWLPEDKRGMWGGTRFTVPQQGVFELVPIELAQSVSIEGKLIDQNKVPVTNWTVYGYPEVPGLEESSTMNSMAGVQTDTLGRFRGSYPDTFPPVRWMVSRRVWKTKYEFDDIKYRAEMVQKSPLILKVNTKKPIED